jgi:hypothetical protein
VKISPKKGASIFSKGSKKSHGNTDQKVGLLQADILTFKLLNLSKRYFVASCYDYVTIGVVIKI